MKVNAFSLTNADSNRIVDRQARPITTNVGLRRLGDTCRHTLENGSILSRAIE